MFRLLPTLTVFLTLAVSGVVSGIWTQRWAHSTVLTDVVHRTQLPPIVGEWDGREVPTSLAELTASQAAAIVRKVYVDRKTGTVASVALICGKPGPVSVHTPDVCFPSSGFVEIGKPTTIGSDGSKETAQLWIRRFQKSAGVPVTMTVYYSWNDGTGWQCPENPRIAFAGRPVLFKLYVMREAGPENATGKEDAIFDLIRNLLPQIGALHTPAA